MTLKEKILNLRAEKKSYKEIKKILGCSSGSIAYHCGKGQKEKSSERARKRRKESVILSKVNNFHHRQGQGRKLKDKTEDFQRERIKKDGRPKLGKRISTFNWKDVIDKFGWETVCYLTGRPINMREPLTYQFDHMVPYAKGGASALENLGIACKQANLAKSDMTVEEYIQICKEVLEYNGYSVKKKK